MSAGNHEPHFPWWRRAAIYEVYVRSFADADGDGLGDLTGIRSRLPYLRDLGIDAIWLTPFYSSPQVDGGYDVADYRDVDPLFGTLADFDDLISAAHDLELRVIVDIVPNHTSSAHPWFQGALASGPNSRERQAYLFRDGRGSNGDEPPNDWVSTFHNSAWTRVVEENGNLGQWYLHLFSPEQPDLNWTDPEVIAEFESILRFWLDRGVDGFRIDVAHGLAKDPEMPDVGGRWWKPAVSTERHPHWDLDEVHDVYRGWRRVLDEYDGDRVFVGEVWLAPERISKYLGPDELHTAFNFTFLQAPWEPTAMRQAIIDSSDPLRAVGALPTWVLSNHDVHRHVTRYGGGAVGTRRARAAALLMFALPGSVYVYQGEELGLPEVLDLPPESREDPVFFRSNGTDVGRDGCRVPIPWSTTGPSLGFGPSDSWLPQPADWSALSVERQQGDPDSMLELYRTGLRIRREVPGFATTTMRWLDTPEEVLAFQRDGVVCVVNMGSRATAVLAPIASAAVLFSSDPNLMRDPKRARDRIPADTTVWYQLTP